MKITVLFCSLVLGCCTTLYAQQHYSCEDSRIGKIITKPITQSGIVHYENAITKMSDKRNEQTDGVSLHKDSLNNVYIARFYASKVLHLDLLFVYYGTGKDCRFQLTAIENEKMRAYRLNGEGQLINWDEKEHLTDADQKQMQKEVDELLKNFK